MIGLLLCALALGAAGLQLLVPLRWWPVDLPLLLCVFAGLARGGGWGLACGTLSGAFLDLELGLPLGLRLAPLAVTGALADALQPGVNRDQPRLQVGAVFALALVHDALLAAFARRLGQPQFGVERAVFGYILPRLAAQALATLPLFWALGRLVGRKVFQDPRHREVKTIRRWP